MKKIGRKLISLRHALNKTQYNIFYMYADPLKLTSDETYKKIKAINNVDNNLRYYIYNNKKKIKKLFTEEKSFNQMKKKNLTTNSFNFSKNAPKPLSLKNIIKEKNAGSRNNENLINSKLFKSLKKDNSLKNIINNKPKKTKLMEFNKFAKLNKLSNEYRKIIKGKLDEELVINPKNKNKINEENKINQISTEENKKLLQLQLNNNIDKNNSNLLNHIFRSVKADNKIFNNCLIKDKIIYDITPLNKSKEKGKCNFSKEEKDKKNKNDSTCLNKDSFFKRNTFFEEINKQYNLTSNNNPNNNFYKEKSFNNIRIKREDKNKRNKNMHSKSFGVFPSKTQTKTTRNIHLKQLYYDLPNFVKNKNIFIYYKNGVGVTRGEKLKFLKTSYHVNLLKPLDTQQYFKIKMPNKIKKNDEIITKKFPINHYNLDVINKNNKKLMKDLNNIQNNISSQIKNEFTNLLNSINDKDINDLD